MDTWISKMVRVRSRRRLAACGVVLAGMVLFGLSQHQYLRNFLLGPSELDAAELDAIADESSVADLFVKVTGSRAIDTDIEEYSIKTRDGVETSRTVKAGYYALDMGERFLICRSASGPGTTFVGKIAPLENGFIAEFFNTPDMRAIRNQFYPFYLNDESYRMPGYIALGGFLFLAIFLAIIARPAWKRYQDPSSHPVCQRVKGWGDPLGIAVEVEREAGTPHFKGRNGWTVTDNYLIRRGFFTFDLLRISDLLWAYKKVTKHSVNFIPTGKTYESALYCYGGNVTIPGKKKTTDAILEYLSQRAPWAIFGFSKEVEALFKKNHAAFCSEVEKRRQQPKQTTPPAPETS